METPLDQLQDLVELKDQLEDVQRRVEEQMHAGIPPMMAGLQTWTMGLMVLALTLVLTREETASSGSSDVVRKESHPDLLRQKRGIYQQTFYMYEGRVDTSPYVIGWIGSFQKVKRYHLIGEGANSIFTVDDEGRLFVNKTLNQKEKSRYLLKALMYDGDNTLVDSILLDVWVFSSGSVPVFPTTYSRSIKERSRIGTEVVAVTATDADNPKQPQGKLRYSLRPEGELSAFEINSYTGVVTSRSDSLDRETRSQYVLVVQAQDLDGYPAGHTATTSVTITIIDINDNIASFTRRTYEFQVPEDQKLNETIGTLTLEDRDEIQNKDPVFTITPPFDNMFQVKLSPVKDGDLMLRQVLDYETRSSYSFTVHVWENNLETPADNADSAITSAQVNVKVIDVDEPPMFTRPMYKFSVMEETMVTNIGAVSARDPDKASKSITYSIEDKDCPIGVDPITGQLFTLRKLDRKLEATHIFQVRAQEEPGGLESFVKVNILVQGVNAHAPELVWDEVFVCEKDTAGTVIGMLNATDTDDQIPFFSFSLVHPSTTFSITTNNSDNTADIRLKRGHFSLDDPTDYMLEVRVEDGGRPPMSSVVQVPIKVCRCDDKRIQKECNVILKIGVGVIVLITILVCLPAILGMMVMWRCYQKKKSLARMNHYEEGGIQMSRCQLVVDNQEDGGEMDMDRDGLSILTSAPHDSSLLRHPDHSPHHLPPPACDGDMAVMIQAKKDKVDHEVNSFPNDTVQSFSYEGSGSLAGSLSSLVSSSSDSSLDFSFLKECGPKFRKLAEMYMDGSDESD